MAITISDSFYGECRDRMKLETTEQVDRACLYLEGLGYHFLTDFGYGNAVQKAAMANVGILPAPVGQKLRREAEQKLYDQFV